MPILLRKKRLFTGGRKRNKKVQKTVSKMIRQVVGRPEMKVALTYQSGYTVGIDPSLAVSKNMPLPPTRGNDYVSRASDKIIIRGYEIRIIIDDASTLVAGAYFRILAFKWRTVNNTAAPNSTQVLVNNTAGIQGLLSPVDPIGFNVATDKGKKAFSLLKDKLFVLGAGEVTAPPSSNSTVGGLLPHREFVFKWRFKNGLPLNFDANTGTVSDIVDNWLGFFLWGNVVTSATATWTQTVFFTDCA